MLNSLFLQVLKMSLTASYVILVVLLLRLVLKRAPKLCSYALWAVVLVRLLCPFSIEGRFSLIPARGQTTVDTAISAAQTVASPPATSSPTGESGLETVWHSYPFQEVSEAAALSPLQVLITIGAILWLAVALILLFRCIRQSWKLWLKLQGTGTRQGRIRRSTAVDTPFVMGIFRPTIYLPAGLDSEEEEFILFHEKTHIRRLDHITRLLAYLACCIHWFNPLVWLAYRVSEQDMELACDERTLNALGKGITRQYSSSILHFAVGHSPARSTLAFGSGDTDERIRRALSYKRPAFWMILAAAVLATAVGMGLLINPAQAETESSPSEHLGWAWEGYVTLDGINLVIDPAELIFPYNTDRIQELGLNEDEIPWSDGCYAYNPDSDDCVTIPLEGEVGYGIEVITASGLVFTGYPEMTFDEILDYLGSQETPVYMSITKTEDEEGTAHFLLGEVIAEEYAPTNRWFGYVTAGNGVLYIDQAEWITAEDTQRIAELGLEEEDSLKNGGFYIYNPTSSDTVTVLLLGTLSYCDPYWAYESDPQGEAKPREMDQWELQDYLSRTGDPVLCEVRQNSTGQWTEIWEQYLP